MSFFKKLHVFYFPPTLDFIFYKQTKNVSYKFTLMDFSSNAEHYGVTFKVHTLCSVIFFF